MKPIFTATLSASSLALSQSAYAFQSIYIVRHAEKRDASSKDPELSVEGQARAANLAKALRDSEITAIYTSEYLRTQKTAPPRRTFENQSEGDQRYRQAHQGATRR